MPGERARWGWLPWAVLAVFAVCTQLWVEAEWRLGWDSSLYILTAQSLHAGEGYSYLGQPFVLRPPGLPWLLSFVLDDGSFDPLLLNRMMMAFVAGAVAALYFALSRLTGPWPALCTALLFGTSMVDVQLFNTVASEYPFAGLLFLGAGWLEIARRNQSTGWIWALAGGAALAGALYMRSAALLVVPALLLAGLLGGSAARKQAFIAALVVAALAAPWIWHTRAVGASLPPSDQLLLSDYVTATLRVDPGDSASAWITPSGLMERVESNGRQVLSDLSRTLLGVASVALGGGLAVFSLAGLWLAARRRFGVLEGFTIFYWLLLLGYFTYNTRLLFPLVPLSYYYLYLSLQSLGSTIATRLERPWFGTVLPAGAFAAAMTLNLVNFPSNLDPSRFEPNGERLQAIWQDVRSTADWILANTAEDAVILCDWAPLHRVLTGRTAYTYRFASNASPLEHYDPDYFILESLGRSPRALTKLAAGRSLQSFALPSQLSRGPIMIHRLRKPGEAPASAERE